MNNMNTPPKKFHSFGEMQKAIQTTTKRRARLDPAIVSLAKSAVAQGASLDELCAKLPTLTRKQVDNLRYRLLHGSSRQKRRNARRHEIYTPEAKTNACDMMRTVPVPEVAKRTGIPISTLNTWRMTQGIPRVPEKRKIKKYFTRTRYTDVVRANALQMAKTLPLPEVARRTGVHRATLHGWCTRGGIPTVQKNTPSFKESQVLPWAILIGAILWLALILFVVVYSMLHLMWGV